MAKLSVVYPNVEVEVGGQKYRKVERKAQAGDIVKVLVDDYIDVEMGAFYAIINKDGETGFYDNDGDFRDDAVQYYPKDFEVYEKVTEPAAVEYRKVKRVAKVGERIKIVKRWPNEDRYVVGDVFVTSSVRQSDGYVRVDSLGERVIALEEYVVLEPVNVADPAPQPERLKVGEYAKVINGNTAYNSSIPTGSFVKIIKDDFGNVPFKIQALDGITTRWARPEHLVRATEAEVEAAERAKNIGEFADGGYAEIVNANYDNATSTARDNNGLYVKVEAKLSPWGTRQLTLTLPDGKCGGYCNADALRKVAREEYEEATAPRSNFTKGDKVRLISGGESSGLYGYSNGKIYTVKTPKSYNGKVEIVGGRQSTAYAKPEQLEKIIAEDLARIEEEAKWAAIGRKVGEYKRGDVVSFVKDGGSKTGVGTVEDSVRDGDAIGVRLSDAVYEGTYAGVFFDRGDTARLIVPVEQRFDRAKSPQAEGGASPSK